MYENILCIGDSFYEGAEISKTLPDKDLVAPAILSKHLNCPFYNFSKSGVGILSVINQLRTLDDMSLLKKNSLILYVLPPSGRVDFFQFNKNERFVMDYWFYSNVMSGNFNSDINSIINHDDSFKKYKKLHDGIGEHTDLIKFSEYVHYSGLCGLFKMLEGYKSVGIIGHPQYLTTDNLQNDVNKLLTENGLLFNNKGFTGWSKENNYLIMPHGHPGIDAHVGLFKILNDLIKQT